MTPYQQLEEFLNNQTKVSGIAITDILEFPTTLRIMLTKLVNGRVLKLSEMAADLDLTLDETGKLAALMAEKGLIMIRESHANGEPSYQVRFLRRKKRNRRVPSDLWAALE